MQTTQSHRIFEEAKTLFPGGVNSPVRAFRSVGGTPRFIKKGNGAYVTDEDDNTYLDFCASWGPLILGHNHPAILEAVVATAQGGLTFGAPNKYENALAKLIIENHPVVEQVRFNSSGTEAVMSAVRLARGATGRSKILKFEGCYHGHIDGLLVSAGSGLVTFGQSSSAGIPETYAAETLVVRLDDEAAVTEAFTRYGADLAAVIIEPIPANNGLLIQRESFLRFLRNICTQHGTLLIFDEVISGFRVAFGGACAYYGIAPDIVTFGKILGGGMPVGAYGASAALMANISPMGDVYQAGTLSGNPVAMAAGAAQLRQLLLPGFYEAMQAKTEAFVAAINAQLLQAGVPALATCIGSIFWLAFTNRTHIARAEDIDAGSMKLFSATYHALLEAGIYFGPSGYEVGFVSAAHTENELVQAAETISHCMIAAHRTHTPTEPA